MLEHIQHNLTNVFYEYYKYGIHMEKNAIIDLKNINYEISR